MPPSTTLYDQPYLLGRCRHVVPHDRGSPTSFKLGSPNFSSMRSTRFLTSLNRRSLANLRYHPPTNPPFSSCSGDEVLCQIVSLATKVPPASLCSCTRSRFMMNTWSRIAILLWWLMPPGSPYISPFQHPVGLSPEFLYNPKALLICPLSIFCTILIVRLLLLRA